MPLLLSMGACGPRAVKPNTDLAASISGRCLALARLDQLQVSTAGPYTVLVRDGGRTVWRGTGKDGERVDVPMKDLQAKAGQSLEVDVFGGDFPPDADLAPGSEKVLGQVLGKRGKDASTVQVDGKFLPGCGVAEGCIAPPCPEPPHASNP